MNVGSQIRKYRLLKGLTQKELGQKALKVKRGADVRINQYEKDIIAPKSDAREALAEALDVDIDALSDARFDTETDIMYILFALEETYGLKIKEDDNRFVCFFEGAEPNILSLVSMIYFWLENKETLSEHPEEYGHFKGRFKTIYESSEAYQNLLNIEKEQKKLEILEQINALKKELEDLDKK